MKPNLLIDLLPETVEIGGKEYSINSGFRTVILFELLIEDHELTNAEKVKQTLELFYEEVPEDIDAAIEQIQIFYACGKPPRKKSQSGSKEIRPAIYSFEYDDGLIFAAFYDQYGIDLNEIEDLHWWKFKAMFDALKSDCEFSKVMSYRATDLKTIKSKSERNRIAKLQAMYALPSKLSYEEKVSAAGAIFGGSIA